MIDSTELERTLGAGFGALFRPYFEGLARGQLVIPRCVACSRHQFPPRSLCVHCRGHDFEWEAVEDTRGTLFTWTVVHHAKGTEFEVLAPYAVALISLEGLGVRIYGLMLDPEGLEIGAAVRPVFPEHSEAEAGAREAESEEAPTSHEATWPPPAARPHWVAIDPTRDRREFRSP